MTELAQNNALPYAERIARKSEKVGFEIDWTGWLSNLWRPGADLAAGFRIRPAKSTGFQYIATLGTTAAAEPVWPTVLGGSVLDGSVTWTAEAVSTASLKATVASSAWSPDSPVSVTNQTQVGQVVRAVVDTTGCTLGVDYYLLNNVTLSTGEVKTGTYLLKVRAGL